MAKADDKFTCPRCAYSGDRGDAQKFCPRCGLAIAGVSDQSQPIDIRGSKNTFRVEALVGVGEACNVYRCQIGSGKAAAYGVFKIVRDACNNHLPRNETRVLTRLHDAADVKSFAPFLPNIEESLTYASAGEQPRQANVLRYDGQIGSPDELYSLAEVRTHFAAGLDARDMAWIWRRLLSVLHFVHSQGVVHGAVIPSNILIEPAGHKLVLIDWCFAALDGTPLHGAFAPMLGKYQDWCSRKTKPAATSRFDIAMGARCMIDLMGGDAEAAECPGTVDPALHRYFDRCISPAGAATPVAGKLLDDFDTLIEALWGKRTFRPLAMPPRGG